MTRTQSLSDCCSDLVPPFGRFLRLVDYVVRLVSEAAPSHTQLAVENLFLRRQLALYLERQVTPWR
jgi:hypothetical protein